MKIPGVFVAADAGARAASQGKVLTSEREALMWFVADFSKSLHPWKLTWQRKKHHYLMYLQMVGLPVSC